MFARRAATLRDQRILGRGDVEFTAPGRAPCVIAFHGFGGTATDLRPVLDHLARAGLAVDATLMPGHGTRATDLQDVTFAAWCDAARERARRAAATHGSFVLVGFSLGSLVALELASERPPGLAGLVVLGNALRLAWYTGVPLGVLARVFGARMPDAYMMKPQPADLVDRTAMDRVVTYDRHPLRAALEVYRAGKTVSAALPRVACPTLVLHGRRDRVCPVRNAVELARRLGTRDVRVRVFERSAHVLGCDGEREDVAREVLAFVTGLERATSDPSSRTPPPPAP